MKKIFIPLFLAILVLLSACGGGRDGETTPSTPSTTPSEVVERRLRIHATPCEGPSTRIDSETLADQFRIWEIDMGFVDGTKRPEDAEQDIRYSGLTDVLIEIGGEQRKLEDALRDGAITEEEIFCYARMDASAGFCEERCVSRHGLSHFTYHYPECSLRIIYDIYETPDGKQHLISDLFLYPPDTHNMGPYTNFFYKGTNQRLDREDWGLTLEVTEVQATGATVTCTQSGGQQIGQLDISAFMIGSAESGEWLLLPTLDFSGEMPGCDQAVRMEGSFRFRLDWSEAYGELPSGEYDIVFLVHDRFDETQVHPLMEDYTDSQTYELHILVP